MGAKESRIASRVFGAVCASAGARHRAAATMAQKSGLIMGLGL
jgi:hypothetical protein